MENYIIKEKNGISFLQFKKLLEYEDVLKHAVSMRPIDIRSNHTVKEHDFENDYKKICDLLEIDIKNVYRPIQTHTDVVKVIGLEKPGIPSSDFKDVDGLITNEKNKVLSISIADCIDLMFFDPVKMVIANTHSGWKGTYQCISKKTVEKMVDNFGCNVKDIICCIGPSIRKCHFEVDTDVSDKFYEKFKTLENIDDIIELGRVVDGKQKYNIDTVLINTTILHNLGLKRENIIDCGVCTVCESDKFHSYRADGINSGRNTGLITLI